MTKPNLISAQPTRKIFEENDLDLEVETVKLLERFKTQKRERLEDETIRSRIQSLNQ